MYQLAHNPIREVQLHWKTQHPSHLMCPPWLHQIHSHFQIILYFQHQ
jgi:hypothetical protein